MLNADRTNRAVPSIIINENPVNSADAIKTQLVASNAHTIYLVALRLKPIQFFFLFIILIPIVKGNK